MACELECSLPNYAFLLVAVVLLLSAVSGLAVGIKDKKKIRLEERLLDAKRRQVGSTNNNNNNNNNSAFTDSGGFEGNSPKFRSNGSISSASVTQPWEIEFSEIKLGKCVAEGSSGRVFKGVWLDTVVAVKVPHPHLPQHLKVKFAEEAVLMSKLHHPNIVMFLAACLNPDHLALVLEFLARGSMHDFLKDSNSKISTSLMHRFAVDIARGMKYLHTRCSIIQRDLKPRNLLIDAAYNVKVCDFGLSKSINDSNDENGMTACGTPYWTAPEVIRNEGYNGKADVFSFAIILFELIAREEPYKGLPGLEVAIKVAHSDLRPKLPSFCPGPYRDLIEACWHADPDLRPTFAEILERLNEIKKEVARDFAEAMVITMGGSNTRLDTRYASEKLSSIGPKDAASSRAPESAR